MFSSCDHTVKDFSVVNEAEMFFCISLAFSMIQWMLTIWSLVPLPFLNIACTSGSSWSMYCWSLAWRILSIAFLQCEVKWSESRSVMSDSLQPQRRMDCRLYTPWNSPGWNTGVDSLSLLQGIFPTQGLNPGFLRCRQILYQLSHKGSPTSIWNECNCAVVWLFFDRALQIGIKTDLFQSCSHCWVFQICWHIEWST